jgi:tetratricopeptide (TPR) repeat protein
MMHQFGMREVEKLLCLPRRAIHGLVRAGFVSPARGPRRTYLFSFQDLIVLRTAQALTAANVPARRINKSLKALRRKLPETMPLSGLAISAVGDRVVVRQGGDRWQAESGQYLLAFDGDPAEGSMKVIERNEPAVSNTQANTDNWFEKGCVLESSDAEAARAAYEHAIAADPAHLGAYVNLGRLLHEAGRLEEAERLYRRALAACGNDSLLWYNLGVLLTDRDRKPEALQAYEHALRNNPRMADCHYNMALLCEALKRPKQAIRHMAQYRKLVHKP